MTGPRLVIVTGLTGVPGEVEKVTRHGTDRVVGFAHSCPCGCGAHSFVRLNKEEWAQGTQVWERTDAGGDDWSKMTLSPSIGIHPLTDGKYHWHGHLRDGVFEGDST